MAAGDWCNFFLANSKFLTAQNQKMLQDVFSLRMMFMVRAKSISLNLNANMWASLGPSSGVSLSGS